MSDLWPRVVVGTTGSPDYLRDTTGNQRFWQVRVDQESCDGLHDESAPAHHLCARCFPDLIDRGLRGDLSKPDDDEYDEHFHEEDD